VLADYGPPRPAPVASAPPAAPSARPAPNKARRLQVADPARPGYRLVAQTAAARNPANTPGGAAPQRAARIVHFEAASQPGIVLTPRARHRTATRTPGRTRKSVVSAPVTPPAFAARLGRLRQESRPLLRPRSAARVLARIHQHGTRRHSAGWFMALQATTRPGGYTVPRSALHATPHPSLMRRSPSQRAGARRILWRALSAVAKRHDQNNHKNGTPVSRQPARPDSSPVPA